MIERVTDAIEALMPSWPGEEDAQREIAAGYARAAVEAVAEHLARARYPRCFEGDKPELREVAIIQARGLLYDPLPHWRELR